MKRDGHSWRWGRVEGSVTRRTFIVRMRWVERRDGPLFDLGDLPPLAATVSECEACGLLCAEADVTDIDGFPRRLRAHGYCEDTLLVGHGVPSCAPGQLSRDFPVAAAATADRRAA